MATGQLQTPIARGSVRTRNRIGDAIEARLEAERERIGLWLPVALGAGIAAWFALPAPMHWIGLLLLLASGILGGLLIGWHRRLGRVIIVGCGAVAIGLLLVWARAVGVAAPVLAAPVTTEFSAVVERVEPLPAKEQVRILALPQRRSDLLAAQRQPHARRAGGGSGRGRGDRRSRAVDAAADREPARRL